MKKCLETCATCAYDVNDPNSTCGKNACVDCPNYSTYLMIDTTPNPYQHYTHCRCLSVKFDDDCPYYKEAKDEREEQ